MAMPTSDTANDIINTVAVEVGLNPSADPFADADDNFVQMRYLINSCIKQLVRMYDWEFLTKEHAIAVTSGGASEFALPTDFVRMIDQTGWERLNRNPIKSMTSQEWQYLKGRDLVSETIHVKFRLQNGTFNIYPSPPTSDLSIAFEYVSNSAVETVGAVRIKQVSAGGDIPLFDGYLLERLLKVKFLQARGFDSTTAEVDLIEAYDQITAGDKSASILNMGNSGMGTPLLNAYNTSDTNFGT